MGYDYSSEAAITPLNLHQVGHSGQAPPSTLTLARMAVSAELGMGS